MTRLSLRLTALALVALTTACASSNSRDTEVTRFHLGTPIERQAVIIEPADAANADSLEYQQYFGIVASELAAAGFTPTDAADAPLRARVDVQRGLQQTPPKRSPFSIGVGGGSFGGNVGVGGSVNMPVGGSAGGQVYVTRLAVTLVATAENAVTWEGTAVRTGESGPDSPTATMQALARALFAGFPGESGKTVKVPDPAPAAAE
ncbi:MAG: DUF4136 domain-containing protein [Gammaproteobacteria bacterium]|jgi:hypothetical protein|nr:DUF4136 domain-containing protein [Gammaproteobacteria bacterium]